MQRSILEAVLSAGTSVKTLLDVGCGDGEFTRILSASLPRTSIAALDVKMPKHSMDTDLIKFSLGTSDAMPFESNSFDVITVSLSLHHWSDKKRGIFEAYRVLREGGRLIIGDPLHDGLLRFRFLGWLAEVTDGGRFATPQVLREYLAGAGFESVEISVVPDSFNTLFLVTATKPFAS